MHRHTIRRSRLVALAVVAILVAFAASSGAATRTGTVNEDPPQASGAVTAKPTVRSLAKQVKRLTRQVKRLTTRVVALEEQTLPPSGPAGGDLSGTYPNPTIANDVVGPGKIPDETLTGFEIAPDSLFANDLASDSVGATELKGLHVVVSSGVAVPAQQARSASAFCPSGEQAISGGGAFQGDSGAILGSTPSLTVRSAWDVRGRAFTSPETLFAWALCLPA